MSGKLGVATQRKGLRPLELPHKQKLGFGFLPSPGGVLEEDERFVQRLGFWEWDLEDGHYRFGAGIREWS